MKKVIAALIAGLFAASAYSALAQDKEKFGREADKATEKFGREADKEKFGREADKKEKFGREADKKDKFGREADKTKEKLGREATAAEGAEPGKPMPKQ